MKKYIILSCLTLLLFLTFSCDKKDGGTKYHWVTGSNRINLISRVDKQVSGDTTIISYIAVNDTLRFYLFSRNRDSSYIVSSYENDGYIVPFKDTTIAIDGEDFKVTQFIQNEEVIDGGVIHYYNPQIGIFASHSDTWPGLHYLQSSDTTFNRKVKLLIKSTVPQFNIRGDLKSEIEKY